MAGTNSVEAVLSNNDLLTQILTRIPPKPLLAFQIVSKYWLSLISDPHFVIAHTRHLLTTHPPSPLPLLHYKTRSTSMRNDGSCICTETSSIFIKCCLEYYPKLDCLEGILQKSAFEPTFKINSSCNGLILFQNAYCNRYIVFNPTTRKQRLLPEPLGSCGYDRDLGTILAFEPLISFHYKVIRFRGHYLANSMVNIDIFSSESGTWKQICLQGPPGRVFCKSTRMVFWNGAIHWISVLNVHMSFIVDDEKFTWDRISINPPSFPEKGDFGYFGKSDTGLLLIKFSSGAYYQGRTDKGANVVFTVLEMNKDNCWSLKHQVDLRPLLSKYPNLNRSLEDGIRRLTCSVLYVKSGTKSGDFSMVLAIPDKIILYEVGKANGDIDIKVLREFPYNFLDLCRGIHPFIECLAPVL